MTPLFLEVDDVLEIHVDQIERYGGDGGVRDLGLLDSAVAAPRSGSGDTYHHLDVCAMAAAYLFHIVKNHPFVDGNKRTGAMAAYVFLRINGLELVCSDDELVEQVLAVAEGRAGKAEAADFFRLHCEALPEASED